jgi:hypothetical protein
MSTPIHWYENPKFDAPHLNSPQPCIHGAGCVYTVKSADGTIKPGCCRYVHPGEEGTGRRIFPARTLKKDGNTIRQAACVRLTGNAGFYKRCSLKLSWQEWCEREGLAFTPNKAGERHTPVKRIGFGAGPKFGDRVADMLKDPVQREKIMADAMAYMAEHPEQGWNVLMKELGNDTPSVSEKLDTSDVSSI